MLPKLSPEANHVGRDVTGSLPTSPPGLVELSADHAQIWALAEPHLKVRNNDAHTIYAYGLARALCDLNPEADPEIVLPAVLLHDTGWSRVPEDEVLDGIAPGGSRPDLVLLHEREGALIARDVLGQVGHDPEKTERIIEIIDGHDSRLHALSLDDSLMKDADKLWRITPHGVDTVMDWFGLTREQAHRLIAHRVHDNLFTDTARTMARVLGAVASIDTSPQRIALG